MVLSVDCRMFFVVKQKTAYEMRISDWSSDVCSSDLIAHSLTGQGATRKIQSRAASASISADTGSSVIWRLRFQQNEGRFPQSPRAASRQSDSFRTISRDCRGQSLLQPPL